MNASRAFSIAAIVVMTLSSLQVLGLTGTVSAQGSTTNCVTAPVVPQNACVQWTYFNSPVSLYLRDMNNPTATTSGVCGSQATGSAAAAAVTATQPSTCHALNVEVPPTGTGQVPQPPTGVPTADYADTAPRPRTVAMAPYAPGQGQNLGSTGTNAPDEVAYMFDPLPQGAGVNYTGFRYQFTVGANGMAANLYVRGFNGLEYEACLWANSNSYTPNLPDAIGSPCTGSDAFGTAMDPGQGTTATEHVQIALTPPSDKPQTVVFGQGGHAVLEIFAVFTGTQAPVATTSTWSLVYDEYPDAASALLLNTAGGLRYAAWTAKRDTTGDSNEQFTTVFRDYRNQLNYTQLLAVNPHLEQVDGWFAAQSAFGLGDTKNWQPSAQIRDSSGQERWIDPWRNSPACDKNVYPTAPYGSIQQITLEPLPPDQTSGIREYRMPRSTDPAGPFAYSPNPAGTDHQGCVGSDLWTFSNETNAQGTLTAPTLSNSGAFTFYVQTGYDPTAPVAATGIAIPVHFSISAVHVQMAPLSYTDFLTGQTTSDTTTHSLAEGGQTTFLINLTNAGKANDTIQVDFQALPASPSNAIFTADPIVQRVGTATQPSGGGTDLWFLGPGNSTVLAFTVHAPNAVGASDTFLITALSTTDPNEPNSKATLTVTAGPTYDPANPPANLPTGAGLVLLHDSGFVTPGTPTNFNIYLWNRGAGPTSMVANIVPTHNVPYWNSTLVQNDQPVNAIQIPQVNPGDLAGATLQVRMTTGATTANYSVELNASTGASSTQGVATRLLTFSALIRQKFAMQIISALPLSNVPHTVDFIAGASTGSGGPLGGTGQKGAGAGTVRGEVNGSWVRVWITNNEAQKETFALTATVTANPQPPSGSTIQPWTIASSDIGFRDSNGSFKTSGSIQLFPGETGEMYVFVQHDPNQADSGQTTITPTGLVSITATDQTDTSVAPQFQSLTINTEGYATGANAGTVTGDSARQVGVDISQVARNPNYDTRPTVDISHYATQDRTASTAVAMGSYALYHFRITNGASWSIYRSTTSGILYNPIPQVTVFNGQKDEGWRTYFRVNHSDSLPANCTDSNLRAAGWHPDTDQNGNPTVLQYQPAGNFNHDPNTKGTDEVWADYQLDVIVCAPPSTFVPAPFAGEQGEPLVAVKQLGPGGMNMTSYYNIRTTIASLPVVTITPRLNPALVAAAANTNCPYTPDVVAGCIYTSTDRSINSLAYVPIYIANNGSYLTNATVTSSIDQSCSICGPTGFASGAGWQVTGPSQTITLYPLHAYENRTFVLQVQFPVPTQQNPNVPAAVIDTKVQWQDNLYDPTSPTHTLVTKVLVDPVANVPDFAVGFGSNSACSSSSGAILACSATLQPLNNGSTTPPPVDIPLEITDSSHSQKIIDVQTPTIPGWVFAAPNGNGTTAFSFNGQYTLPAGGTDDVGLVVTPPKQALAHTFIDIPITIRQDPQFNDIRTVIARVTLGGGVTLASASTPRTTLIVPPNGQVTYVMSILNQGSQDSSFRLSAAIQSIVRPTPLDPHDCTQGASNCWQAYVTSTDGQTRYDTGGDFVTPTILKNQAYSVGLTIKAPLYEQPTTYVTSTLTITDAANSQNRLGQITVKTIIQTFGVQISAPQQVLIMPAQAGAMSVFIKNVGNANDTFNLSMDTLGLPWTPNFQYQQVFLTPGTSTQVRLTIQSPISPLPAPRTAKFWLYGGSLGNHLANATCAAGNSSVPGLRLCIPDQYGIQPVFITVPQYRVATFANQTELAVDQNLDLSDGYESFAVVPSASALVPRLVDKALGSDHHFKFLVEVPTSAGVYSGVATLYWDPDANVVTQVVKVFDLNRDGTADYLLDTHGGGVVDTAYETATRQFLQVWTVHILGADSTQYLISTAGDGRPEKYYDPASGLVTPLQPHPELGANVYGVDTVGDGRSHVYYDYRTLTVTPVQGVQIVDFAKNYWYIFGAFIAVVLLFGLVLVRRRGR